mgnify:CR=1 FL=1
MIKLKHFGYGFPLLLGVVFHSVNAEDLTNISVIKKAGTAAGIDFNFTDKAVVPKYFSANDGKQLIFDFPATVNIDLSKSQLEALSGKLIKKVSVLKNKTKSRIIVDLFHEDTVRLLRQQDKVVQFGLKTLASSEKEASSKGQKLTNIESVVADIKVKKGLDQSGIIEIKLPKEHGLVTTKKDGDDVLVKIHEARLADKWLNKMNVTSFLTPLVSITGSNGFAYAELRLKSNEDVSYEEVKDGDDLKIIIRKQSLNSNVFENNKKITLNLQDISVRAALQIIANFASINMVVNDSVSGAITLGLKDVPWQQALDIILVSESLGKRQIGSILYIAPASEIVAHEKSELSARQASEELAPLYTRFYPLNYATAAEALTFLQSASGGESSVLTPRGSLQSDQRTNTLVIRDTEEGIQRTIQILKELDVPVEQVLIEARIVEINKNFLEEYGLNWGGTGVGTGPAYTNGGAGPNNISSGTGTFAPLYPTATAGASTLGISFTRLLGGLDLNLELRALETEGHSKIVSSPHLTVSDNQEAYIKQGQEVPYLEASASGAASVAFKEAVLELRVTPQIAPDNSIILDIEVKNDRVDTSAALTSVPSINTREIKTRLMTYDGETIVLGGIYEKTVNRKENQVPLLGDIPFLGWLFKSTSNNIINTELLIFITPKIVRTTIHQHDR